MNNEDKLFNEDSESFKAWWRINEDGFEYQEWIAEPAYSSACTHKNQQLAELEAKLAECQAREERLSVLAIKWCPLEHHNYDEIKEYMAQDRSALDAMLAQHAHDTLQSIRPTRWNQAMNDAWHQAIPDVHKAFDDLISVAEEQLKP